jgi:hypothetical protein
MPFLRMRWYPVFQVGIAQRLHGPTLDLARRLLRVNGLIYVIGAHERLCPDLTGLGVDCHERHPGHSALRGIGLLLASVVI